MKAQPPPPPPSIDAADDKNVAPGKMLYIPGRGWGEVVEVLYGGCPAPGLTRTRAWVDYGGRLECCDLRRSDLRVMVLESRPARM